jgi:hypothetical protein
MSPPAFPTSIRIERFTGGAGAMSRAGIVGIVGLVLTLLGFFLSPRATAHSYLIAFSYWCGIAVASLILLCAWHTAKAKWPTVLRRALETQALTVVVFAVLFLPILLSLKTLYPWALEKPPGYSEVELHHLHYKQHGYLNLPFFLVRQVLYFGIWWFVSSRLHRWSVAQDDDGALDYTVKARRFAPPSLPFVALAITFASFDWLMSLTPLWQSTMFGVYFFAGSFLAAFAVLTINTVYARGTNLYGELVTLAHFHSLGKFLLAFVSFWAYIGFSQFMLIWIANLPEEAPWYAVRIFGAWRPVSIFLFFAHFVVPFIILLSRDIKLKPYALRAVAYYLLAIHYVDLWWLVWPSVSPERPGFHWTMVTSFVGVGGLAVAYGLRAFRGRYTVPIKDPYIADSLRYVQP